MLVVVCPVLCSALSVWNDDSSSVLAMYLLPVGDVSYDFVAHREVDTILHYGID